MLHVAFEREYDTDIAHVDIAILITILIHCAALILTLIFSSILFRILKKSQAIKSEESLRDNHDDQWKH